MAKGAGLSGDAVLAARHGEASPLAAFARKVTTTRGTLSTQEIDDARAMGLSDASDRHVVQPLLRIIHFQFRPS